MRSSTNGSFVYLFVVLFSALIYLNALKCEFVFDDSSAIVDNRDLRPNTPVNELFKNDFWGTRMNKESSHKSYRPLTVLTFRWNYALGKLDPFGYHAVNVVLHCCVTTLFYRFSLYILERCGALAAALLFAVHPIHVEAVTSVVGRAELLSAVFFLFVLTLYIRLLHRKYSFYSTVLTLLLINILIFAGTLCKEQCITVVAVAFAYDFLNLFINTLHEVTTWAASQSAKLELQGLKFPAKILLLFFQRASIRGHSPFRQLIFRAFLLAGGAVAFLLFRLRIMKSELPHFTPFDNPAAHAEPLSRRLTHLYLIFFNLELLFFPSSLCADWTMGSIPLVTSWKDGRNLQTLLAFCLLFVVGVRSIHPHTPQKQALALMMGLSLLVFPFIPASNLFFYVGFVVAERVLYIPSLGFCLLIGLGFQNFCRALSAPTTAKRNSWRRKVCPQILLAFILAVFACKTIRRNYDWADEYSLFTSAVRVNQRNAKLWNNVGHALEAKNNYSEALHFFQRAVEAQPNDMGAHINVGRTFVNLGLYKEAEAAYTRALDYFPKPRKGMTYHTRVSPKDLTVFINLANLLVKDPARLKEADALLRRAISLREDYVDAYQNRGSLLVTLKRLSEAEQMYRIGLKHQPTNAALLYNLGVVLLETNRTDEAYLNFHKALFYDPGHEQTKFVLATSYADTSDPQLREKARLLYEELSQSGFEPVRVHFGLALLYSDVADFEAAIKHYNAVLKHDPTHRSSLFNMALMYNNELRQPLAAIPLLKQLIEIHPSHTKSYLLLGDIELSVRKNPTEAQRLFEKAVSLEPENLQARHNLCVSLVDGGDLVGGERCLVEAARLATDKDHYIFKHLSIVRARLAASVVGGTLRSPSKDDP